MKAHRSAALLVLALLAAASCGYESSGTTTTTTVDPETLPPPTGPVDLVFENQQTEGSSVVVASVSLPATGFVALHADQSGSPGEVIGVSESLTPGLIANVVVPLFVPIAEETVVHVMAHIDVDRDGVFSYEPPDAFIDVPGLFANGEVASVAGVVGLLPALSPSDIVFDDQRTVGQGVAVGFVTLPGPGFVVIQADREGVPGVVLGISDLLAEGADEATVTLDDPITESGVLWATAVVDRDGDGSFLLTQDGGGDRIGLRSDGSEAIDPAEVTVVAVSPVSITVEDGDGAGGTEVVVSAVSIPSEGFVVVRSDVDGQPGEVLAISEPLSPGTHEQVLIPLDPPQADETTLWLRVHIDVNGDGRFGPEDAAGRFEDGGRAETSILITITDGEAD